MAGAMLGEVCCLCIVTQMRELLAEASTSQVSAIKLSIGRQLVTAGLGLAAETVEPRIRKSGTPSNTPTSPNETTSPNPVESPDWNQEEDEMFVLRPEIINRYHPRSFRAVYEEFHGMGEYDGVPIAGGLAEMDRRYKTKWRSGDIGYQRAFSRMQQICKAVEIEVENGKMLDVVLDEFD